MQTRHNFNALAMQLRIPCIKPLKVYVMYAYMGYESFFINHHTFSNWP